MRRMVWGGSAVVVLLTLLALGWPGTSSAGYSQAGVTPTLFIEPEGCWQPPDDYTRTWVNGEQVNLRTLAMLDHAQELYAAWGGISDFRQAITQGGYTGGALAASFGTHDGGGAVDLSVLSPIDGSISADDIDLMLRALRIAGFAAWLREPDELYPGSIIHIHAIAIGDQELSEAARAQLDGTFGYLRGYNGLPQMTGIPIPDRYGGPVLCHWMFALGFSDMRGWPNPYPTPGGTTVPQAPIP